MEFHYDPETDALYINIGEGPSVETREILEGFNIDLDVSGVVIGFEFDHVSQLAKDLGALDIEALPLRPGGPADRLSDAA